MAIRRADALIKEYISKYEPLDLELRRHWFRYETTGDKGASAEQERIELAIRKLNSDAERFSKLKTLYESRDQISDELIRRQIEVLYLRHLPNQISADKLARLTRLERNLQEAFNDYQPEFRGRKITQVEADHILADSADSEALEEVWKSQARIAVNLDRDYRELVNLRNEIARDLGFENALALAATVDELDFGMLERFYADVRVATDVPFRKIKDGFIDPRLAVRYGVDAGDLMPWHYQNAFFQEVPTSIFGDVDLDRFYEGIDSYDVIARVKEFYASLGVDVGAIVGNSSLFPAPGKNPHAVAWFLDPNRRGSAVLIMNLPEPPAHPKAGEASTLVHELAHDINYEAILGNASIPYLLRDPTMLTEAFAMLLERQTQTREWFLRLGADEKRAEAASGAISLIDYVDQLIFLRWALVIFEFERSFYTDPGQDIGDLWWSCKEKYQFQMRPPGWRNPDALAKYHIPNVSLLYYSNYAIGRIANVQFADLMAKRIGQRAEEASYFGKKNLGEWLMRDFLAHGERYRWDEFLVRSTGGPLSVEAWKKYYIDSDLEKRVLAYGT